MIREGAPVVQEVDSSIHRINHYPLDNAIDFPNTYPLDSAIQRLNKRGLVDSTIHLLNNQAQNFSHSVKAISIDTSNIFYETFYFRQSLCCFSLVRKQCAMFLPAKKQPVPRYGSWSRGNKAKPQLVSGT